MCNQSVVKKKTNYRYCGAFLSLPLHFQFTQAALGGCVHLMLVCLPPKYSLSVDRVDPKLAEVVLQYTCNLTVVSHSKHTIARTENELVGR